MTPGFSVVFFSWCFQLDDPKRKLSSGSNGSKSPQEQSHHKWQIRSCTTQRPRPSGQGQPKFCPCSACYVAYLSGCCYSESGSSNNSIPDGGIFLICNNVSQGQAVALHERNVFKIEQHDGISVANAIFSLGRKKSPQTKLPRQENRFLVLKNMLGVGGESKALARIHTCCLCNLSFLSGYTQLRDHLIRNLAGLAPWGGFEATVEH